MSSRRPRSLSNAVALTAVAVLAGWVIVVAVGVNLVVANRLNNQAEDLLRTIAQEAAATVQVGSDGVFIVRPTSDDAALDVGTWILNGNQIIEGPVDSRNLDAAAVDLANRGQLFDQTPSAQGVRWYAEPIYNGTQQVGTVVTAVSLAPYQATGQYTAVATVVLAVLLLVGAYLALRAGVGRALRPVQQMTDQAARWSATEVDKRFGDERRPEELDRLAITLDLLLDRMSAVLRNERQLSAEISHELRTPLARASAEIQLLAQSTDSAGDRMDRIDAVQVSLHEMATILETLMSAARLQSSSPPGRCDAVAVIRALVQRDGGSVPTVEVIASGPVAVGVDAAVLERTLSPLLDNARRYARSAVKIEITALRGAVRIAVVDDGPGIPDADLPHIFDPGYQGRSSDGHGEAGLGLALSRRLVMAADGSITAANGPGAIFTTVLPAG